MYVYVTGRCRHVFVYRPLWKRLQSSAALRPNENGLSDNSRAASVLIDGSQIKKKLGLLVLISWTTDRSICHCSKSWSAASRPCGGDQFPVQCQSSRCLVQIVHPRRNHRSWLPVGSAAGSHHIRCSGKHVSFLTTSRVTVQLRNAKITMIKCARN